MIGGFYGSEPSSAHWMYQNMLKGVNEEKQTLSNLHVDYRIYPISIQGSDFKIYNFTMSIG